MNDDSTSSIAGNTRFPAEGSSSDRAPTVAIDPPNGENRHSSLRKRVLAQTKKKADFVNDIMQNLDMLIYAELCIMYYLE